ncbi:MAG: hypothetical protein RMK15_04555 [Chloroflexota bacterium]|nr:hypothetical protein [Chloroflexota bacterium]
MRDRRIGRLVPLWAEPGRSVRLVRRVGTMILEDLTAGDGEVFVRPVYEGEDGNLYYLWLDEVVNEFGVAYDLEGVWAMKLDSVHELHARYHADAEEFGEPIWWLTVKIGR